MREATVLRRFNRAYTQRVGVLESSFLQSGRPLGEARLLYEIGNGPSGGPEGEGVVDLRRRLGLDSGYLSRLLRALEADGLVTVGADATDGRRRRVELTAEGWAAWGDLERRSEVLARRLVGALDPGRREALAEALATAERLVRVATVTVEHLDPAEPDAGAALAAYFAELDRRFEGGFDPGEALRADAPGFRPPAGRFLVARNDDEVVGCGALQPVDQRTAEIKRMWVAPGWRGAGIGARLLASLEHEAADTGYTQVVLDTNAVLTEAIALYERSGYRAAERYNGNPYAQRWFTKPLAPAIRPWSEADRDALLDLVLPIQREEFGLAVTLADQPDLADPEAAFRAGGGEVWVARHGGAVVGSVGVLRASADDVVLRKMFVRRDQRGGGLAAALLNTAVRWATEWGYQRMLLGTTAVMDAAQRFYAGHGFERIDEADLPGHFPRMAVDSVFFARDLRPPPGR
ncbi:MAG: GNAT family N-acetyltransferase [Acidimicrobiales bacterium]